MPTSSPHDPVADHSGGVSCRCAGCGDGAAVLSGLFILGFRPGEQLLSAVPCLCRKVPEASVGTLGQRPAQSGCSCSRWLAVGQRLGAPTPRLGRGQVEAGRLRLDGSRRATWSSSGRGPQSSCSGGRATLTASPRRGCWWRLVCGASSLPWGRVGPPVSGVSSGNKPEPRVMLSVRKECVRGWCRERA